MERFERACRAHRLKITPQRTAIYREVVRDRSHPTAERVYRRIRRTFPTISFDTVNRTLLGFSRIGLLDTIECSGLGRMYETETAPHHHIKCRHCGVIIDFYNPDFDRLPVPEGIRKKYDVIGQQVVLKGTCPACQKKGGRKNGNQRQRDRRRQR